MRLLNVLFARSHDSTTVERRAAVVGEKSRGYFGYFMDAAAAAATAAACVHDSSN